jgi:MSHA biogenesis protein MshM
VKAAIGDTEAACLTRKKRPWAWLPTSLFIAASVVLLVLTNTPENFNLVNLGLGWIK